VQAVEAFLDKVEKPMIRNQSGKIFKEV